MAYTIQTYKIFQLVIVLPVDTKLFIIIRAFYLDVDCVTNTQFQDFVRYETSILLLPSFMLSLSFLSYIISAT